MNKEVIEYLKSIRNELTTSFVQLNDKLETFLQENERAAYLEVYKNVAEQYKTDPIRTERVCYCVYILTKNKKAPTVDKEIKELIRNYNIGVEKGSNAIVYALIGNDHSKVFPIRINKIAELLEQDGFSCWNGKARISEYNYEVIPQGISVEINSLDFQAIMSIATDDDKDYEKQK